MDGHYKMINRKIVFLALLNLFIFVYFQMGDTAPVGGHQALIELHPEKMQLLTEQQVQALPPASAKE